MGEFPKLIQEWREGQRKGIGIEYETLLHGSQCPPDQELGEETQEVLVLVPWGEHVDEREQRARVDLEQLYPPLFMQSDRLINLFAMFSSAVSDTFKA